MQNLQGSSFMEVLIALSLFSAMMIFVINSALFTAINTADFIHQAIAESQIRFLIDRLTFSEDFTMLNDWNNLNADVLPGGKGLLNWEGEKIKIRVSWGGQAPEDCHFTLQRLQCVSVSV